MEAIDEYIRLAEAWGTALEAGDSEAANSLHDRIQGLFQRVRQAKQDVTLFERADTVSDAPCFFIASHLKESDPPRAIRLYQRLVQSSLPFIALSARHALADMSTRGN